jgi:hypothetical protein
LLTATPFSRSWPPPVMLVIRTASSVSKSTSVKPNSAAVKTWVVSSLKLMMLSVPAGASLVA